MRDIIWTIILVWLVWKVYDMFKGVSKHKSTNKSNYNQRKEGEIKIETNVQQKSYFNKNDGEYVDYEEIK